jgi:ADP-L-glycero-D-manno-heptose 6-epimerase
MVLKQLADDKLIVLTGGAGFIGSQMIAFLNERGFANIIVVDDLGHDYKWHNLVGNLFAEIVPIHDLFDWLEGRESEIQAIVHLGACSDTAETDADYLLENNYRYSLALAEYALANQIRFVYASSAATYGDGSQGFSDQHEKLESLRPLNMYGYSKHLVDLWMKQQGVLDEVVGLKYFNVFGPSELHKGRMASVVPKWVSQAHDGNPLRLFKSSDPERFSDGEQQRDFIYVKDAVRMTANFLTNDLGGIFNIGRGEPTTWNTLARAVFAALKLPEKIEYIEMPEDLLGKYQNYTCADMRKYSFHLPLETTPIDKAVADYIQNYLLVEEEALLS